MGSTSPRGGPPRRGDGPRVRRSGLRTRWLVEAPHRSSGARVYAVPAALDTEVGDGQARVDGAADRRAERGTAGVPRILATRGLTTGGAGASAEDDTGTGAELAALPDATWTPAGRWTRPTTQTLSAVEPALRALLLEVDIIPGGWREPGPTAARGRVPDPRTLRLATRAARTRAPPGSPRTAAPVAGRAPPRRDRRRCTGGVRRKAATRFPAGGLPYRSIRVRRADPFPRFSEIRNRRARQTSEG